MNEVERREWVLESRTAVDLVADKWRLTILHALAPGSLRHGQLQRALGRISPKVLTQTLRGLERDGLVHREVYAVVPPKVEYSLTEMGTSLLDPLRELCHWAKDHSSGLKSARTRYDRRNARRNGAAVG